MACALLAGCGDSCVVSPKDSCDLVAAEGSKDKQVAIYPGDWHSQGPLYGAPFRNKVDRLITKFLRRHSQD